MSVFPANPYDEIQRLRQRVRELEATIWHLKSVRDERLDALLDVLKFYATALVAKPTPGSGCHNCDDGAYARAAIAAAMKEKP